MAQAVRDLSQRGKLMLLSFVGGAFLLLVLVIVISVASSTPQSEPQKTVVVSQPSRADYGEYKGGMWLWRTQINRSAIAALSFYEQFANGNISEDQLRNDEASVDGALQSMQSSLSGAVPASYQLFDSQADTITSSEASSILDLETSSGSLISDSANKLKQFISEFNQLSKKIPQPSK